MQAHSVLGGGGVRLHVVETGNPSGQAILFLHGFSGGHLVWRKQLESDLANDFRLVAMDLRGHGLSDKPRDSLCRCGTVGRGRSGGGRHARTGAAGPQRVVVRRRGHLGLPASLRRESRRGPSPRGREHEARGAVDALPRPAVRVRGRRHVRERRGAFIDAAPRFLRLLVTNEQSHEDLVFNLGVCMTVPLYVRQGMFSRTVDNDDVLRTVRKPVLITHGESDAVVLPALALHHGAVMPHAQLSWFPNAGHAPHWDDPDRFNNELGTFAERVASAPRVLAT